MVVDFDDEGRILIDSIDPDQSGAWAAIPSVTAPLQAEPVEDVVAVAGVIREIVGELDGNAYGITDVFLDGRRSFVRSRETNLGNLSADANLWYGQVLLGGNNPPMISVKNGGGIRAPIGRIVSPPGSTSVEEIQLLPPAANDFGKPEGGVSQLDIQTAFAFNNGLAVVTLTAAELHDLVEQMIKGDFTHTAGLRVEFDPSGQARSDGDVNLGGAGSTDGERVQKLEALVNPGAADKADQWDLVVDGGMLQGDTSRTFRVLALDFLASCAAVTEGSASCGSGWPFNGLTDPAYLLLDDSFIDADPGEADFSRTGSEQDAFAEFMQAFHPDQGHAYGVPVDVNERLIPLD